MEARPTSSAYLPCSTNKATNAPLNLRLLSYPTVAGRPRERQLGDWRLCSSRAGQARPLQSWGNRCPVIALATSFGHYHRTFTRQHSATRVFFAILILSLAPFSV